MPDSVRDNVGQSRFELEEDGNTAVANYRLADGVMTFTHTETPPALRGRGVAGRLIHGALTTARTRGLKVVAQCPFVAAHIARHPEFADLLK